MTGDVGAVGREVTSRRRTVLRRVLPVVPAEGPWMIGVSYPVGDSAHCYDYPVKEAFYTTDWPGVVGLSLLR